MFLDECRICPLGRFLPSVEPQDFAVCIQTKTRRRSKPLTMGVTLEAALAKSRHPNLSVGDLQYFDVLSVLPLCSSQSSHGILLSFTNKPSNWSRPDSPQAAARGAMHLKSIRYRLKSTCALVAAAVCCSRILPSSNMYDESVPETGLARSSCE